MPPTPPHPNDALKTLGRRIREWRKDAGYTQETLAKEIGVNRITVMRLETGKIVETVILGKVMALLNLRMVQDEKTPAR